MSNVHSSSAPVLTQDSRAAVQPASLTCTKAGGTYCPPRTEELAALQPSSAGFLHPWCNSTPYRLEKHRARCTVASLPHTRVGVAVAGDAPSAHFKNHIIETKEWSECGCPRGTADSEGGAAAPSLSSKQHSLEVGGLLLAAGRWSPAGAGSCCSRPVRARSAAGPLLLHLCVSGPEQAGVYTGER